MSTFLILGYSTLVIAGPVAAARAFVWWIDRTDAPPDAAARVVAEAEQTVRDAYTALRDLYEREDR